VKALPRPRRHAFRAAVVALFAVVASSVLAGVAATSADAAPASDGGFVRLAHLSPDTPPVDVYLDALSFTMPEKVFQGVAYGTVSGYLSLPAGLYSVGMRLAGAPRDTPVVITTNVPVEPGHAYTVAGVGKHADLGLRIIADNLSNPTGSRSMVRIVQASISAPVLDVSINNGETVATNVKFATTTAYESVKPGTLTLEVGPAGGKQFPLQVTLKPGCVYSILVLDSNGALTAQLRTDAESRGTAPVGGVPTGGGGMSSKKLLTPTLYVAVGALLLAVALLIRRRPHEWWTSRPSRSL
jgi:hypothetical protein